MGRLGVRIVRRAELRRIVMHLGNASQYVTHGFLHAFDGFLKISSGMRLINGITRKKCGNLRSCSGETVLCGIKWLCAISIVSIIGLLEILRQLRLIIHVLFTLRGKVPLVCADLASAAFPAQLAVRLSPFLLDPVLELLRVVLVLPGRIGLGLKT